MTFLRFLLRLVAIVCSVAAIVLLASLATVILSFRGTAAFPADCGVVFGAAVQPLKNGSGHVITSQAGPAIIRRVGTAAGLLEKGLLQRLFLTGGRGEGMLLSEAEVMRDVAISGGVPPNRIALEKRSTSTEENISNTMPLTDTCNSIVAISDDYHLARIAYIAGRMGWNISTYPAEHPASFDFELRSIFRETFALLYEVWHLRGV